MSYDGRHSAHILKKLDAWKSSLRNYMSFVVIKCQRIQWNEPVARVKVTVNGKLTKQIWT